MQRSIYTNEQLSVQKYVDDRKKLKMTMQSSFVEIKKKELHKHLQSAHSIPPWILANDFIQFLHLIDDIDADFELLQKLMDKFKLIDVKNLRNINVGTILMKMLHHFKRDLSAQKVFGKMVLDLQIFSLSSSHFYSILVLQRFIGTAKFPNGQTK